MSLARWLRPLTRRAPAGAAAGAAAPTATQGADLATAGVATPAALTDAAPPDASSPWATTAPASLVDAAEAIAVEEPAAARNVRFFRWMVGVPAAANAAARHPLIEPMLARLDEVIASESLRAGLLPRAPHVIPQLMKTLRDETYSSADVASRISKDATLTAEVVRSATAALQRGADGDEIDLARAVAVIGTQGLRRAISSVVLRPIFDSRGTSLSARAATQIWIDADRKAKLCAAVAGQSSADPFDGYLAGLLHNSGWTAALRAIDGFEDLFIGPADLAHPEVVPELVRRRDRLFGAFVGAWSLGAGLDALAAEVAASGLDDARSPLGLALREADRLAALRALVPPGERPAAVVPRWSTLARPVQDCYRGLAGG
jgi:hypothetical protein